MKTTLTRKPTIKPITSLLPAALAALFAATEANAVVLSTTENGTFSYSQDFNTLPWLPVGNWTDNSTLTGWYAARTEGPALDSYRTGGGSSTAGGLWSFGTGTESERALGSLATDLHGTVAFGLRLQNGSATKSVTGITITYTGEQWRDGGAAAPNAQTLTFGYQVSASAITSPEPGTPNGSGGWNDFPSLSFTTPTFSNTGSGEALDGNAAGNQQAFSAITLTGVSLAPGQELFIRWRDINDAGNDHGFGVDDLTISYTVVPEPSVTALLMGGSTLAFALARRRFRKE